MNVMEFVTTNWASICGIMYVVMGGLGHVLPEPFGSLCKAVGLDFGKAGGSVSELMNPKPKE